MTGNNEKDIIQGLINGNKATIDFIYQQYHKRIYAFAIAYMKQREDALDVVHEVFLKIWQYRANLKPDHSIEPLIFTITRNTVLSAFRKRAAEEKYLQSLASKSIHNDQNTETLLDYSFLKESIEKLVDKLPQRRREIFILSRHEGLTNKEIAHRLQICEKTVEDHMTKALAFIRKHLEELGLYAVLYFYLFL